MPEQFVAERIEFTIALEIIILRLCLFQRMVLTDSRLDAARHERFSDHAPNAPARKRIRVIVENVLDAIREAYRSQITRVRQYDDRLILLKIMDQAGDIAA